MKTLKQIKKAAIAVAGFTVLLIGVIVILLPGTSVILFPLGLTILAPEFIWAKRWLEKVNEKILIPVSILWKRNAE
ncbi:MAG: hypothetical protein C0412_06920 [Flavobacterium sp.]|nr:hypothetical protein [Flavobacterium sp.]